MTIAYVGLGANLGDREQTILEAAHRIGAQRISTLIETEPWGVTDQPHFLNAVAEVPTTASPGIFLLQLLKVERDLGRIRDGNRWGPRLIDLDLLLYGNEIIDDEDLHVPHPHLHERTFVLQPLAELAPDLIVPGRGPVAELLRRIQSST
ncbi:MAG: 2-amino-4-hydroxy-6-hydroxymethyldihydropteridine diphosphokinase [Actinobacteria bacterium]|uniref:2-amino-4-hydroxy-6-hydroxymethyldihydropteridine diphosphokinase n=1 Tax=freshwater metagenome TaxID=449393 RepID=A0A6J6NN54_9ZZZZ|nr:2-amino-4-hydroxy-6-hydroxymethyldihydropteridine diphosphokinase [Actinomycetota bacterium]